MTTEVTIQRKGKRKTYALIWKKSRPPHLNDALEAELKALPDTYLSKEWAAGTGLVVNASQVLEDHEILAIFRNHGYNSSLVPLPA